MHLTGPPPQPPPVPGALAAVPCRDGVVSLALLRRAGVSSATVHRAVAEGSAWRPAPGALAVGAPPEDHRVESRLRVLGQLVTRPDHCATRASALELLGLPLLGRSRTVQLGSARHRTARPRRGLELHPHPTAPVLVVPPGCTHEWPVSPLARALAEYAMHPGTGVERALVPMDAALHAGRTTLEDVAAVARPGLRNVAVLRRALELADPLCESPGETRTRLALVQGGLTPRSQVTVQTPRGRYRLDLLVEELRVALEFDGAVKYDGASGRQALVAEKVREDALREMGLGIVRVTWPDLHGPDAPLRLCARVRAAAPRP